jgi:AcrR family transcriptional regulator
MVTITKSKEEVVQEYRIQSIQEATMRVIARKGMASATMQEIAEEAGVAKGTIYLYFRDRDELVEKTFENAMGQLMAQIDQALAANVTFEEKLRAVMTAKLAFFTENREFIRLYLSLRMPEGNAQQQRRQKQKCEPHYAGRVARLTAVIDEAIARGEVRPIDSKRLAIFLIEGSTAIMIERLNEESSKAGEGDVDLIVGLILDGIRKRS